MVLFNPYELISDNSWGPLHMDKQRQDDQLEPEYNSSVPKQDVALKTYRKQSSIEKSQGEGQGDLYWWCDMMMMMI